MSIATIMIIPSSEIPMNDNKGSCQFIAWHFVFSNEHDHYYSVYIVRNGIFVNVLKDVSVSSALATRNIARTRSRSKKLGTRPRSNFVERQWSANGTRSGSTWNAVSVRLILCSTVSH